MLQVLGFTFKTSRVAQNGPNTNDRTVERDVNHVAGTEHGGCGAPHALRCSEAARQGLSAATGPGSSIRAQPIKLVLSIRSKRSLMTFISNPDDNLSQNERKARSRLALVACVAS